MITEENAQDFDPKATETATQSLGAMFHQARTISGLEQKDVAGRLKMNVTIIQAIEANEWQKLGAPVFVRMYLQRYAQLLNLPETNVLASYKAMGIDDPPPLKMAHSAKPQHDGSMLRWVAYPVLLVLLVWLGWFGVDRLSANFAIPVVDSLVQSQDNSLETASATMQEPNADTSAPSITAASDAEETILTTPVETQLLSGAGEARADEVIANVTAVAETTVLAPELAEISAAEDTITPETGAATQQNTPLADSEDSVVAIDPNAPDDAAVAVVDTGQIEEHQLFMRFEKDSWVEVKDASGERLAYGIFKANATGNWSGLAPFSITLGNAQGTEIKLNGETIDRSVYAPKRGTVSRFILDPAQQS